jgi:biopolymer transport protein ExbB/TolQ
MLSVPVSRIKTASMELIKAVELREGALQMDINEFNDKYNQAVNDIETIRHQRKNEFQRINKAAQRAYENLGPTIENYWPSMEKAARNAIDNYVIKSVEELQGPALTTTQEKMVNTVKNTLENVSHSLLERIQNSINTALEREAENISEFEELFFNTTNEIQKLFIQGKAPEDVNSDTTLSTIANSIAGYGIGGVYLGYKQSGLKGALLGGATGFGGMAVGNLTLFGLLLPALAIPVTWPIVIIGGIAVGILSTFTSKWTLDKIFPRDQIGKFKTSFKENINNELDNMKKANNFSETVHSQIQTAFEALKTKIQTETENVLTDTQNQLTQLKIEIASKTTMSEKEKDGLKKMLEAIGDIYTRANNINEQLTIVLSR